MILARPLHHRNQGILPVLVPRKLRSFPQHRTHHFCVTPGNGMLHPSPRSNLRHMFEHSRPGSCARLGGRLTRGELSRNAHQGFSFCHQRSDHQLGAGLYGSGGPARKRDVLRSHRRDHRRLHGLPTWRECWVQRLRVDGRRGGRNPPRRRPHAVSRPPRGRRRRHGATLQSAVLFHAELREFREAQLRGVLADHRHAARG
mmetsp:Transcript_82019/g.219481  ORF Transcript_82019/g.219481 Transcript_82019/m.219481 type:complete len:201 (-) Transcript_82019:36-638(-)